VLNNFNNATDLEVVLAVQYADNLVVDLVASAEYNDNFVVLVEDPLDFAIRASLV